MANNSKITFLIPTYNGEKHLARTVDSIINEGTKIGALQYEILICVNGSTDRTKSLIEDRYQGIQNLKVIYFDNNLGYDANLIRAVTNISGEFVWFVGDDDVILPGAACMVLNELDTHKELNFILLEPIFFETDDEIPEMTHVPIIHLCENHIEYFKKVKWNGSALSSVVIRRPSLDSLKKMPEHYGQNWIHLVLLFERVLSDAVMKSQKYSFISKGTIAVRDQNPRWKENFGNYVVVGINHIELLRKLLKGRDEELYKIFYELRKQSNWNDVKSGYKHVHGKTRRRFIGIEVRLFWRSPHFWILTFPLLILPEGFRKIVIRGQEYFILRILPSITLIKYARNGK